MSGGGEPSLPRGTAVEQDLTGQWVQVWGQVTKDGAASTGAHPEDVVVRFESHNADYLGDVRRDRVVCSGIPEFAPICTALGSALGRFMDSGLTITGAEHTGTMLVRCTQPAGHASVFHRSGNFQFTEVVGHIEEVS